MRVMNSVFRIENDILLLNTYFNLQIYKKSRNRLDPDYSGQGNRIKSLAAFLRQSIFRAALNNLLRKDNLSLRPETMAKANLLNVFRLVAE